MGSKQGAVRPAGLARANELELKIPRLPPVSERWWAPWRPKIVRRAGRERRERERLERERAFLARHGNGERKRKESNFSGSPPLSLTRR